MSGLKPASVLALQQNNICFLANVGSTLDSQFGMDVPESSETLTNALSNVACGMYNSSMSVVQGMPASLQLFILARRVVSFGVALALYVRNARPGGVNPASPYGMDVRGLET